MRLGVLAKLVGGVNKFVLMPMPSSFPVEQFVLRMNRDTPYSGAVVDMSSDEVCITVSETDKYVSIQIVDENHETQPMIYGSGRHKITAKTARAFVVFHVIDGSIREKLLIEAGTRGPLVVKKWDLASFLAVEKQRNDVFCTGYDQSKAFGNVESRQTA